MAEIMDAKTAAERTKIARTRVIEEMKTYYISLINATIAEGKYYIRVTLLDYWNLKEFESLWFFFTDRGYELSIAGISDFVKASELYIKKGFLNVTIYWGDAS